VDHRVPSGTCEHMKGSRKRKPTGASCRWTPSIPTGDDGYAAVDCDQSSVMSPGTWLKSRVLRVTSVAP
jgi:hypothetical protein